MSFVPITNPEFYALLDRYEGSSATNLFFFAHLAELSGAELLAQTHSGAPPASGGGRVLHDLSAQVVVNSRIARRKLAFFEWGTWFYVSGLLTPVAAFLLFWISGGPGRFRL